MTTGDIPSVSRRCRGIWRVAAALTLAAVPANAQGRQAVAPASAAAPDKSDSAKMVRAFLEADEQFYATRLLSERALYLKGASWAELGDRCNPGDLRVFPQDTSSVQQDSLQRIVERMESTIIARGVGQPLDTPEARALFRVLVGWEAGIDRPSWDSDDKDARKAVAAGLTGEVPDPRSSGCLPSPMASDTVTFVLPGAQTLDFPRAPRPRVKAYFGPEGQRRARDEFFAVRGKADPEAELTYVLVAPLLVWRDWALVAVDRPREKGGVEVGGASNGGAVYMLRRVGTEWRLLSVVRSWGS